MAHLSVTRTGWENEHLATFLLSRIAFVAHPVTVADDIGSDFFCTIFEPIDREGGAQLFPLSSFAIQVKSNRNRVPATNKIDYLISLELPFFLGVVDRAGSRLAVYSGEQLPIMFAHLGRPSKLLLCPVDQAPDPPYTVASTSDCTLRMPLVVELSTADNQESLLSKGKVLAELCSRMHANLSAFTSKEYIFRTNRAGDAKILAGPGSAQTFRHNFYLRLAEVFYNLQWLFEHKPEQFSRAEFDVYERLYKDLVKNGSDVGIVSNFYERLKKCLSAKSA